MNLQNQQFDGQQKWHGNASTQRSVQGSRKAGMHSGDHGKYPSKVIANHSYSNRNHQNVLSAGSKKQAYGSLNYSANDPSFFNSGEQSPSEPAQNLSISGPRFSRANNKSRDSKNKTPSVSTLFFSSDSCAF